MNESCPSYRRVIIQATALNLGYLQYYFVEGFPEAAFDVKPHGNRKKSTESHQRQFASSRAAVKEGIEKGEQI